MYGVVVSSRMTKLITIYKVVTVEEEISLIDFINKRGASYLEYISKDKDTVYITDEYYPNESFIMIFQEIDTGEISYHELGYVLCPTEPEDLKQYVKDHIDEYVDLDI